MAIPADTIWEVRPGGSDTQCGGGFSASMAAGTGVDLSQSDTAAAVTGALTASSNTITDAHAVFLPTHKGNTIQISGVGIFMIKNYLSASQVALDRAPGTIPGGTVGYIGGALATPGMAAGVRVDGNGVYLHGPATYTIINNAQNVSGGYVNNAGSGFWAGYSTNRTPLSKDARCVTIGGSVPNNLFQVQSNSARMLVSGIIFNGTPGGINMHFSAISPVNRYYTSVFNCEFGFPASGGTPATIAFFQDCVVVGCQGAGSFSRSTVVGLVSQQCSLQSDEYCQFIDCILEFYDTVSNINFPAGLFYGCSITGAGGSHSIATSGSWAISSIVCNPVSPSSAGIIGSQCALNCMVSQAFAATVFNRDCDVRAIADNPYTNIGTGDFSLSGTAAALACKGTGYLGVFPDGASTGVRDKGAVLSGTGGSGGGGGGGLLVAQGDGEMDEYLAGSTSVIEKVRLLDSTKTDGSGKTGLAYNTSSFVCWYKRSNATAAVAVTLANIATLGTFVSGGFKEIDGVNMPGEYEFHPPNAAMAAGAKWVEFTFSGPAGMAQRTIRYRLVAFNPDNGTNLGLTYLVNPTDPLGVSVPGSYAAGTVGYLIGTNLDAKVSTRSTYAGGDTPGTGTLLSRVGTPTGASLAADIAQVEGHAANADTQSAAAAAKATAAYNVLVADEYTDRSGSPWKRVLIQQGTGDLTTGVKLLVQRLQDTAGNPVTASTQVIGAAFV